MGTAAVTQLGLEAKVSTKETVCCVPRGGCPGRGQGESKRRETGPQLGG